MYTEANFMPYDVFVCVREEDENGRPTWDSMIAVGLHPLLEGAGLRVFFGELQGQDQAPAALESAKVMIVVGTSAENLNAESVRGEYRRFRELVENGAERRQIIAYVTDVNAIPRDMGTPRIVNCMMLADPKARLLEEIRRIIPIPAEAAAEKQRPAPKEKSENATKPTAEPAPVGLRAETGKAKAEPSADELYAEGEAHYAAGRYAEAAAMFCKAAKLGNMDAMYRVGMCYWNSEGLQMDPHELSTWFIRAANLGHVDAMYRTGMCFRFGMGLVQDLHEASMWFRKAAELGNADAMTELAEMYENGTGMTKDPAEALKWYRRAAESGSEAARARLAEICGTDKSVGVDPEEARRWVTKASAAGEKSVEYAIAEQLYILGKIEFDACSYSAAAGFFSRAAELGNVNAMGKLADLYETGNGVPRNLQEAFKWYLKAAECGEAMGMYNVAICYEKGKGTTKDLNRALFWYEKSAAAGNSTAKIDIFRLRLKSKLFKG